MSIVNHWRTNLNALFIDYTSNFSYLCVSKVKYAA